MSKRMAKADRLLAFSLRLSPAVHADLKRIAGEIGYGVTITRVVHQAIAEFIERKLGGERDAVK